MHGRMRIAILGTRGIPANYGGFETFAEELAPRLSARGHDVTVYGRSHHVPPKLREYRGVRLVVLPTIRHKYLDTVVHTWLSTLHALTQRYDVVLFCNVANAFCIIFTRLFGIPAAINVDGLEWKRRKWNRLGQWYYRMSEKLACRLSRNLVTDARAIQDYYREVHGRDSSLIAYGASTKKLCSIDTLTRFGLSPRKYFLHVSRLEPENNADAVVEAFRAVETDFPLVIVGDAPYATDYVRKLKSTDDRRVVFTGYVFGDGYRELVSHAYCQVHATEVGGTHPALTEAMGMGNGLLVNDVDENREVARDAAWYFRITDSDDLTAKMKRTLADPEGLATLAAASRERVAHLYQWDTITTEYEELFSQMLARDQDRLPPR